MTASRAALSDSSLSPLPPSLTETQKISSADVILARNYIPSLSSSFSQENHQQDVQPRVLENLELSENSLETFRFELHPEEELVRRG